MPGSYLWGKREVARHVREQVGQHAAVVDVGPGRGWWADLVGHGRMDAVEVTPEYVERYGLRAKYGHVHVADVRSVDLWAWHYAIIGDVLEHLPVADAQRIVREATAAGVRLLVAVPYLCPQDAVEGIEAERHLQPDLTPELMAERYPELRLLLGDERYGYFVNYDAAPLRLDAEPPWEPPQEVPVLWVDGQRGYWDHGMLAAAFRGELYATPHPFRFVEREHEADVGNAGCVAVIAGRWKAAEPTERWRTFIDRRSWTLAVVASDEESVFDPVKVQRPTSLVWAQTPSPGLERRVRRPFILGWRTDTRSTAQRVMRQDGPPSAERRHTWSFSGQTNNPARDACADVLGPMHNGLLHLTGGFGQGLNYDEYVRLLLNTHIVPSPSGSFTPDCFRTWEALELGCLPVADADSPGRRYAPDYYAEALQVSPETIPFPRVRSWREFPRIVERYVADRLALQRDTNRAFAWWQGIKRRFVLDLERDIHAVSGMRPQPGQTLRHKVTVIIPTSPIPSHPSTEVIERAVRAVRAYPDLADAEIIVCIDGIREEQAGRAADYEEFKRRLLWLCNWHPDWRGVLPLVFDAHTHQAGMARAAFDLVQTPYVLYVEHDTWPCGTIPWRDLVRVLDTDGAVNVVRLHHEAEVHPEHRYLLPDGPGVERREVSGVPMVRTRQWSQRPHLARLSWYRQAIAAHFRVDDRTFIEDVLHGAVQSVPWEWAGLWFYAPPGDMKRSDTNDGRGGDPKYPMLIGGRWV